MLLIEHLLIMFTRTMTLLEKDMESIAPIIGYTAIMLCIGLWADNMLMKRRLKLLEQRVSNLEKPSG
jgi:hypothetical protein